MSETDNQTYLDWAETIIVMNSLIRNIENIRFLIETNQFDDDELYDAQEELNDYVSLLIRLRDRYNKIPDKGEITGELKKKLATIC